MINRVVLMKLNDRADNSVIAEMQAHVARIGAELEKARAYHLTPNEAAGHAGKAATIGCCIPPSTTTRP